MSRSRQVGEGAAGSPPRLRRHRRYSLDTGVGLGPVRYLHGTCMHTHMQERASSTKQRRNGGARKKSTRVPFLPNYRSRGGVSFAVCSSHRRHPSITSPLSSPAPVRARGTQLQGRPVRQLTTSVTSAYLQSKRHTPPSKVGVRRACYIGAGHSSRCIAIRFLRLCVCMCTHAHTGREARCIRSNTDCTPGKVASDLHGSKWVDARCPELTADWAVAWHARQMNQ